MTGFALMMVALSGTAGAAAYDRFPMDSGNFWIFDAPEGHRTIAVEHTDDLGDGWFASDAAGLLAEPVTVYDHSDDDEMIVEDGAAGLGALFDFGAADGDAWDVSLSSCEAYTVTAAIGSAGQAVTPAGTFTDLSRFTLDHDPGSAACGSAPLSAISFAEDVGPVRFTDAAGAQGRLLYAFVGGAVVAASSHSTVTDGALSVTLVFNDDEVDSGAATAVAVLRNRGDAAVDLTRSGFVIDIFDRVSGGSRGRVTLGSGEAMSLAPGGLIALSAALDLSGLSGDLTVSAALRDDRSLAAEVDVAR